MTETGVQRFRYEAGAAGGGGVVDLGHSDVLTIEMQVMAPGEALPLEPDGAIESMWYVVAGNGRFVDAAGAEVGVLGASGGVMVPRNGAGKIEVLGDADLVLLHVASTDPRGADAGAVPPAGMLAISYDDPEFPEGDDIVVPRLWVGGDMLTITVEKVRDGEGDDPPHAHFGIVGAWYMLSGRVRFHGMDDADAFEMTTGDAVFLPSGTAYGFRALDHEPAHVLHVKALDLGTEEHERVDY